MIFNRRGNIGYYSFNNFEPLKHGIFTRSGGISPKPWNSLNLGGTNGDDKKNVIENRKRIFDLFSLPVESIFDSWQVHGTHVICTNAPRALDAPHQPADSILTSNPDVTLFMRFADCVPLFFWDPVQNVIGIAHAGWKGTVNHIGKVTVLSMHENHGSKAEDIVVGIGPSIGPDHYEIGSDLADRVKREFPEVWKDLLTSHSGRLYLDLWKANQYDLEKCSVSVIESAGICTACHTDEFFSHRIENGKTGRFGALLSLRG